MTSPLAIQAPPSLQEVFDKDPTELTDADIDFMIQAYRAKRLEWNAAEDAGKHKRVKKEQAALPAPALGDLDL